MILKKDLLIISLIFITGFSLRFLNTYPANTIIGFDQARDLSITLTIFKDADLKVIGPTAGNNPNLHHGVAFLYYILPPLFLFGGNPICVVLWNSLFNTISAIILFFLGKRLQGRLTGLICAFIAVFSFQFIQFSGWLSNPTATIFTVPLFFLGLWLYYQKKDWSLVLCFLALGLSIQFELFFIYLIPAAFIIWVLLKLKSPPVKILVLSIITFLLTTSTMVVTETKFKFAGILSILNAGSLVGGENLGFFDLLKKFMQKFWESFALNLYPQEKNLGVVIGVFIITVILFGLLKNFNKKQIRDKDLFILIYLFSPFIMLLLGYHNAPWFLVGLPPAIALASGYVISKIKPTLLIIPILLLIGWVNLGANNNSLGKGQIFLEPDPASLLSDQLKAIDYTYQGVSQNEVTINSLTNPLYINAVWSYHYNWYGLTKYGFLPSWSGGDQLHPYDLLPKPTGKEKYLYLLIDTTKRIPYAHRLALINWADQRTKLIEEKEFGGVLVQKREYF